MHTWKCQHKRWRNTYTNMTTLSPGALLVVYIGIYRPHVIIFPDISITVELGTVLLVRVTSVGIELVSIVQADTPSNVLLERKWTTYIVLHC